MKISKGFNICTCSWEGSLSICEYSVFLSSLFAGAFGAHAIVCVVVCTFVPLGEASQNTGRKKPHQFHLCTIFCVRASAGLLYWGICVCVCCWYLCACKRCDVLGGCCFSQVLPLICYITALSMSCQLGNLATTPECTREKPPDNNACLGPIYQGDFSPLPLIPLELSKRERKNKKENTHTQKKKGRERGRKRISFKSALSARDGVSFP